MLAVVRLRHTRAKLQEPSTSLNLVGGPFHLHLPATLICFSGLSEFIAGSRLVFPSPFSSGRMLFISLPDPSQAGVWGTQGVCLHFAQSSRVRICFNLARFTSNGLQSLHTWLPLRLERSPPDMQMASGLLGPNSPPNMTGYHSNKTQLRLAASCYPPNGECVQHLAPLAPLCPPRQRLPAT